MARNARHLHGTRGPHSRHSLGLGHSASHGDPKLPPSWNCFVQFCHGCQDEKQTPCAAAFRSLVETWVTDRRQPRSGESMPRSTKARQQVVASALGDTDPRLHWRALLPTASTYSFALSRRPAVSWNPEPLCRWKMSLLETSPRPLVTRRSTTFPVSPTRHNVIIVAMKHPGRKEMPTAALSWPHPSRADPLSLDMSSMPTAFLTRPPTLQTLNDNSTASRRKRKSRCHVFLLSHSVASLISFFSIYFILLLWLAWRPETRHFFSGTSHHTANRLAFATVARLQETQSLNKKNK